MAIDISQMLQGTDLNPLVFRTMETNGFFGTEFWAAIAGAVVGGLIALVIHYLAYSQERIAKDADRLELSKVTSQSLLFKVMRIQTNFFHLHLHLEEAFASVPAEARSEPHRFVLGYANRMDSINFTPEELSAAISLGGDDLLNEVLSLDALHNSFVPVFDTYAELRSKLEAKSPPARMEGTVGEVLMTQEIYQQLRPEMVVLNDLIFQSRRLAGEYFEESEAALGLVVEKYNEKFGKELSVPIEEHFMARLEAAKELLTPVQTDGGA